MVDRPASAYRKTERPYTRREYMKGVPVPKIRQFETGDQSGDFDVSLHLVADEPGQIRHNALEAARIAATRYLEKTLGHTSFHLKVRIYPHHVLRENPIATGAGADRVQDGMRLSFGKPIGMAARVKMGQQIITLRATKKNIKAGKIALKRAGRKLPVPFSIKIHEE